MNETYIEDLGTVRECLECGNLVVGGPTRCVRCANEVTVTGWRRWVVGLLGIWLPPVDKRSVVYKRRADRIIK